MRKTLIAITALPLLLGACAAPHTLVEDANKPFLGGKVPEIPSTRPQPRPERASDRNPDCLHKHISQECDPEREPPQRPEPPEVECTMLWKPGTMLAIREKECAALA